MPARNGQYFRPQIRNGNIYYRCGWFFVTFLVFENKSELGAIIGSECILNDLGTAVKNLIVTLPQYNSEVYVDSFVVMPNHVHLVIKIEDRPTNDAHHLGKIICKLKSLAAREYRLLKEHGRARDIGTKLWQANYWDKIITDHEQLEAIRAYITNNPQNWSLDRFGPVTAHSLGNLALLEEPMVAFVASQEGKAEELQMSPFAGDDAPALRNYASLQAPEAVFGVRGRRAPLDQVVISTFTSPQEREVLTRLLSANRGFIAVYPGGIPAALPQAIAASLDSGRALLLSPVEPGTGVNKKRAVWCNEYVLRKASRIWCGTITRGGTLESILKGIHPRRW